MNSRDSQNFNRTIRNSDAATSNADLTILDNMEFAGGRDNDSNQPLSARVNDNPDLCDRQDQDKIQPVASNEDFTTH